MTWHIQIQYTVRGQRSKRQYDVVVQVSVTRHAVVKSHAVAAVAAAAARDTPSAVPSAL